MNFINPDEAIFSDANRPRDSNGFKILPWMQMKKWKMREKLEDVYLNQITIKGACITKGVVNGWNIISALTTPYFKKEYEESDLAFLLWYKRDNKGIDSKDILAIIQDRKAEVFWKPVVSVKDWDIVINKTWTYIVQFYADIIYPYPRDTSRLDKEYLRLVHNWNPSVRVQQRSCASVDWILGLYAGWLKAGDRLNLAGTVVFADSDVRDVYFAMAINIIETS